MTISFTSPLMTGPLLLTLLETITAMYCGTVDGGFELSPGRVVHVPPHVGAAVPFSKPLNEFEAGPPLKGLLCDHCEPQKLIVAPLDRFAKSPMTNWHSAGNWNGVQASPTPSPSVSL